MKKTNFKRFMSLCLAVLALVTACGAIAACRGSGKSELSFKNDVQAALHQVFISPSDSLEWEEDSQVNLARISPGSTINFNFDRFKGHAGGTYDIGTYDVNRINYDCYEVVLKEGDSIVLSGNENAAVFTVTHADGTVDTYAAEVFADEE